MKENRKRVVELGRGLWKLSCKWMTSLAEEASSPKLPPPRKNGTVVSEPQRQLEASKQPMKCGGSYIPLFLLGIIPSGSGLLLFQPQ